MSFHHYHHHHQQHSDLPVLDVPDVPHPPDHDDHPLLYVSLPPSRPQPHWPPADVFPQYYPPTTTTTTTTPTTYEYPKLDVPQQPSLYPRYLPQYSYDLPFHEPFAPDPIKDEPSTPSSPQFIFEFPGGGDDDPPPPPPPFDIDIDDSSPTPAIADTASTTSRTTRPASPTTDAMKSMMSVFRVDPFSTYDADSGTRRKRRKRGSTYARTTDPEASSRVEPLLLTFQLDVLPPEWATVDDLDDPNDPDPPLAPPVHDLDDLYTLPSSEAGEYTVFDDPSHGAYRMHAHHHAYDDGASAPSAGTLTLSMPIPLPGALTGGAAALFDDADVDGHNHDGDLHHAGAGEGHKYIPGLFHPVCVPVSSVEALYAGASGDGHGASDAESGLVTYPHYAHSRHASPTPSLPAASGGGGGGAESETETQYEETADVPHVRLGVGPLLEDALGGGDDGGGGGGSSGGNSNSSNPPIPPLPPISHTTHTHTAIHGPAKRSRSRPPTKMHICWICHKEFPRPSGLATHMNTHSGAKPFKCPIPACSKTFAVRSNARRHLRIHGAVSSGMGVGASGVDGGGTHRDGGDGEGDDEDVPGVAGTGVDLRCGADRGLTVPKDQGLGLGLGEVRVSEYMRRREWRDRGRGDGEQVREDDMTMLVTVDSPSSVMTTGSAVSSPCVRVEVQRLRTPTPTLTPSPTLTHTSSTHAPARGPFSYDDVSASTSPVDAPAEADGTGMRDGKRVTAAAPDVSDGMSFAFHGIQFKGLSGSGRAESGSLGTIGSLVATIGAY